MQMGSKKKKKTIIHMGEPQIPRTDVSTESQRQRNSGPGKKVLMLQRPEEKWWCWGRGGVVVRKPKRTYGYKIIAYK